MKVIDERKAETNLCYSDLKPGDIFEFVNDVKHRVYMKTDDYMQSSICLTEEFKPHNYIIDSAVRLLKVELHILKGEEK